MNECAFGTKDETYLEYHDYFWGQLYMIVKNFLS